MTKIYDYVITIDGTSGVGKGTLAKLLADKLGAKRLDSGAIYRAGAIYLNGLGFDLTKEEFNSQDEAQFAEALVKMPIRFVEGEKRLEVYLGDNQITDELRREHTAFMSSKISQLTGVRKALFDVQVNFAEDGKLLIAEGRDMGINIFPTAKHKFYLDASTEVKAQRRFNELAEKGEDVSFDEIFKMIVQRDANDKNNKNYS